MDEPVIFARKKDQYFFIFTDYIYNSFKVTQA